MTTIALTEYDIETILRALRREREYCRERGELTANLERLSDKLADAISGD